MLLCYSMPNYRFLLESKERLQIVNIDGSKSIETATRIMRRHFEYEEWRIVNIAEKPQEG